MKRQIKYKTPDYVKHTLKTLNSTFRKNFTHDPTGYGKYCELYRSVRDDVKMIPFVDAYIEVKRREDVMDISLALRNERSATIKCRLGHEEMEYSFFEEHILIRSGRGKSENVVHSINALIGNTPLIEKRAED